MKSFSDVIAEVWESPDIQKKLKETLKLMNNVNPSEKCVNCKKHCGKGHMLCPDCYGMLGELHGNK